MQLSKLPHNVAKRIEPEPNSGCWLWTGAVQGRRPHIYGKISVTLNKGINGSKPIKGADGKFQSKPGTKERFLQKHMGAYRWVYEFFHGSVPPGLQLDHLCRTPLCVNPAHLEPVTAKVNMRRWMDLKTHCINGHSYTPENTYWEKKGRSCRKCRRIASAEYRNRQKAGV